MDQVTPSGRECQAEGSDHPSSIGAEQSAERAMLLWPKLLKRKDLGWLTSWLKQELPNLVVQKEQARGEVERMMLLHGDSK